jgi:MOSC domain-containing protein YiiM
VHLVHAELHDELREAGFTVAPGQMGENVTTSGIDLLGLATGTRLHLGVSPSSRSPVCATPAPSSIRFKRG